LFSIDALQLYLQHVPRLQMLQQPERAKRTKAFLFSVLQVDRKSVPVLRIAGASDCHPAFDEIFLVPACTVIGASRPSLAMCESDPSSTYRSRPSDAIASDWAASVASSRTMRRGTAASGWVGNPNVPCDIAAMRQNVRCNPREIERARVPRRGGCDTTTSADSSSAGT
jgi:hypothetical protein